MLAETLKGVATVAAAGAWTGAGTNALAGLTGKTWGLCLGLSEMGTSAREIGSDERMVKGFDAVSTRAGSTGAEDDPSEGAGEEAVAGAFFWNQLASHTASATGAA